ncbi:MAG: hypothetical protein L0H84_03705, partial [Pseudonocardia sp.]|nr:hypothetical protein [Pseudonocardia sp.]
MQRWSAAQPVGHTAGRRWACVGTAVPTADPGWLVLSESGLVAEEWWLAGVDGPCGPGAFLVDEVRRDERGALLLSAPPGLPTGVRSVWAAVTRPVDALLARLTDSEPADLAAALARGQLDGPPDVSAPHPVGLSAEQAQAYRACRTPGLRLVWAPAGPDTTAVVSRATADLVRAGRRVLLLGATDAAVDVIV